MAEQSDTMCASAANFESYICCLSSTQRCTLAWTAAF